MTQFSHIKKSTTLFPQRILNSSLANEKLLSDTGNDSFRFEHKLSAINSNNISECQANKFNESWKIKLETSQKQSEDIFNIFGCEPSTSKNSVSPSQKKNKLSFKLKSVKCFLCSRVIKVEHIPEHLLFCEVKCTKCSAVFKTCQDFQLWTVESKMGNSTCEHILQYSRDPLESLKMQLSSCHSENGLTVEALEINSHIRTYVSGMNSLSDKLPWQQAVLQFKIYEGNKTWELPAESEHIGLNQRNGAERVIHSNHNNNSIPILDSKFNGSSYTSIGLQDGKENRSIKKIDGKEFTSKDNSPGKSTKCVKAPKRDFCSKTVECSNNMISHLDSKSPKKKRKTAVAADVCKKKLNGPRHKSTDYVETPSNGFYYVVRHSIAECPNCYELISPSDFTVNIVTFLMTAVCSGCGLTIYIVHDPPDESGPRVCIVTDQKAGKANQLSQRKKFTHKSLPEAVIG